MLLEVKDLNVRFATPDGEVKAVNGIDLDVERGETLGIVGESGSGKSQLAFAIMGLLARNGTATGSVRFEGQEILNAPARTLSKLRAGNFGLVISDWNMQPMTGLDLLKEVRADARLKSTPFIMITAESKTENVIAAKQAGVSNYIVKPFNAETLREKIAKVMQDA